MTDGLPLVTSIALAASADEVWRLATQFFALKGLSRVNYGFTRFRSPRSMGDPDDALFLSTCDADYVQRYFRGKFFVRTPVYHWAEKNVGSTTWAFVRQAATAGLLSADELASVQENARIGVTAGITISYPANSSRSKGALGLIADTGLSEDDVETLWARERDALEAVAHIMHLKLIQFPIAARTRPLTSRQREALEWVADGKTTLDVAVLLGVSAAMVEKHLRLAREVLSVETTAQAVAKATLLNLIFQTPAPANDKPAIAAG